MSKISGCVREIILTAKMLRAMTFMGVDKTKVEKKLKLTRVWCVYKYLIQLQAALQVQK